MSNDKITITITKTEAHVEIKGTVVKVGYDEVLSNIRHTRAIRAFLANGRSDGNLETNVSISPEILLALLLF